MSSVQPSVDVTTIAPEELSAATPVPDLPAAIVAATPHLTAPDRAVAAIDQLRRVPVSGGHRAQPVGQVNISGGTIYGPVAGTNYGTQVMVNGRVGSLVNLSAPFTVRRLPANPVAPASIASFLDREGEAAQLHRLLSQGSAVWLHGAPGSGLSATTRFILTSSQAGTPPDGVLYLQGAAAQSSLEDLVQSIFSRFFSGSVTIDVHHAGSSDSSVNVHVSLDEAKTHLGTLRALFAFDGLPHLPGHLQQLRDLIAQAAVVVTSNDGGPDTFEDVELDGLPKADAAALFVRVAGPAAATAEAAALVDRLVAILQGLPLPLKLAARLVRHGGAPLSALVTTLENRLGLPNPHAAATKTAPAVAPSPMFRRSLPDAPLSAVAEVILQSLASVERAVLEVLVRSSGRASLAMLAEVVKVAEAEAGAALQWLGQLGIVEAGDQQYAILSASLSRVLDRVLPPSDVRKRIAAYLAAMVPQHGGDPGWFAAERGNIEAGIRVALENGDRAVAISLIRGLQPLLVIGGSWDAWQQNIVRALDVAEQNNDPVLRAWALHERGTRAGLLGDMTLAKDDLDTARRLRTAEGDTAGAAASEHNLRYFGLRVPPPPPPPPGPKPGNVRLVSGLLAAASIVLLGLLIVPPIVRAVVGGDPTPSPAIVVRATETATASPTQVATLTATSTAAPTSTGVPTPPAPVSARFASSEFRAGENDGRASIRIILPAAPVAELHLLITARDGSATRDSDYTPIAETVIFAAGETERTVRVPIVNDTAVEGNETIKLEISGQEIETDAAGSSAELTIVDDDRPPTAPATQPPPDPPTPTLTPTETPTLTPTETPTETPTPDLVAPDSPSTIFPAQGDVFELSSCGLEQLVTLRWTAVQDPSGVEYVWVVEQASGDDFVTLQDDRTADLTASIALGCGRYRWSVGAVDGADNASVPSAPVGFTVAEPADVVAPGVPDLIVPADGSVLEIDSCEQRLPVTFSWTAVEDPSGVEYVWTVEQEQRDESYVAYDGGSTPDTGISLELGCGSYAWAVQAVDGAGNAGATADSGYFTVREPLDVAAPPPPMLQAPEDQTPVWVSSCEVLEPVTLSWTAVDDPSGVEYRWVVWQQEPDRTYILLFQDQSIETSASIEVGCGRYRWSVQAVDGAGNVGESSSARSFFVSVPRID